MRLRSSAAGRERWDVPCVYNHPAWAATLETIIGSEEGIEFVFANPMTGRVLVEFDPSRISAPAGVLLERALAFRPMTASETVDAPHAHKRRTVLAATLTTELVCSIFKFALVGICPCTAAVILPSAFLLHRIASDKQCRIPDDNKPNQLAPIPLAN
jgi:hypothetical protein